MTQPISNFIREHYMIVARSPDVRDLNDAKNFFLCTGAAAHQRVHALFINTFSRTTDAVLVEGAPSLETVQCNQYPSSCYLNPKTKLFVGWDLPEVKPFVEVNPLLQESITAIKSYLDEPDCEKKASLYSQLLKYQEAEAHLLPKTMLAQYKARTFSERHYIDQRFRSLITTVANLQRTTTDRRIFALASKYFVLPDYNSGIFSSLRSNPATIVLTPIESKLEEIGGEHDQLLHRLAKDSFSHFSKGITEGMVAIGNEHNWTKEIIEEMTSEALDAMKLKLSSILQTEESKVDSIAVAKTEK